MVFFTQKYSKKSRMGEEKSLNRSAGFQACTCSELWEERPANWNLWGSSVGARDFSPDRKRRYFGTEVPCPDNDKHQFCVSLKLYSLIAGAITTKKPTRWRVGFF